MLGQCPTCLLKENREADLPLILLRQSGASRSIIVIAVNSEYLSLAANWICRANSLRITNYILLAEDRLAYRILRKMDVPVVLRKDAPYRKQAASIGSKEFQETLYLRAIFLQQVMALGFDLVLSHLDTVWYQNPLPLFAAADCDMMLQFEAGQGRAGGGIVSLRHNRLGLQFVSDYLECEYENYAFISLHGRGRFTYSDDPDIDCLELISQRMERRSKMRRCALDPQLFVSERLFFDAQLPQHRAVWPMFVHLNAGGGVRNKTTVFLDWDLWAVDEGAMTQIPLIGGAAAADAAGAAGGGRREGGGHTHMQLQCKREDERVAVPGYERQHRMRFVINLLASTEHFALEETLAHLSNAQYDSETPVDLHLTIQQAEQESSTTGRLLVETTRVANDFVWQWGEKRILYLDSFVGPSARWIDSWSVDVGKDADGAEAGEDPDENDQDEEEVFQLALYPGMIVSSQWFAWTRQALQAYYFHPFPVRRPAHGHPPHASVQHSGGDAGCSLRQPHPVLGAERQSAVSVSAGAAVRHCVLPHSFLVVPSLVSRAEQQRAVHRLRADARLQPLVPVRPGHTLVAVAASLHLRVRLVRAVQQLAQQRRESDDRGQEASRSAH